MNFVDAASNTRFHSVGSAKDIYNLDIGAAAIANWKGVCTNTKKGVVTASKYGATIMGDFTGKEFHLT